MTTEWEIRLEEATARVLVSFVQFGPESTESDIRWANANEDAKTPEWARARKYAMAALRLED